MEYAPYLLKEQGSNEKDFYNFINKNGLFMILSLIQFLQSE